MFIEANNGWPSIALSVSFANNINPAHVPHMGNPSRIFCCNGSSKPYNTINLPMVVLSPPGNIIPSKLSKCLGSRTASPSTPNSPSNFKCASKSPCNAKAPIRSFFDPYDPIRYHPRRAICSCSGNLSKLMPTIGSPRFLETSAMIPESSKCVVARTIALARFSGSPDLKMPDPTKTPSAPRRIIRAASAGVAQPPAEKFTTGNLPFEQPRAPAHMEHRDFLPLSSTLPLATFANDEYHPLQRVYAAL